MAPSAFPSQNVKSTSVSDRFWKLTCRKVPAVVARSTFPGQNVQSTSVSDRFLKLRCRKSARRFDVQMPFCVAGAGDCEICPTLAIREGFVAISNTSTATIRYTTQHYTAVHYATLRHTTQHATTLHSTTLLSATPH